jgi:NAD(P)H-hydrate repair Nnr-like enzyme with NAD(P)H-hydrate dehydratase domain
LRRAADALGCDLVYLLVPRRPLTAVVRDRARELVHRQVAGTEQSMRLEDQATGETSEMEDRLTEQLVKRGGLWS